MGNARGGLANIVDQMNQNEKVKSVFVTNIAGKDVDWEMTFQFNLDNDDPFYLVIRKKSVAIFDGINPDANILLTGESKAIVRICEGKGDFTHAISREQISVEKGKVMDIIRLTRAITITLKN